MILCIIALVIIFILFVLTCPFYVSLEFKESMTVKARVLFFWVTIFPKKEKKIKKPVAKVSEKPVEQVKKEGPKKSGKVQELIKQKGLKGFLNILKEVGKIILRSGKQILDKIVIDEISLSIGISGEDAADTAVKYGETCACVFPFMNIILNRLKVKNYSVKVSPDFLSGKNNVNFKLKLHIKPITIIKISLCAFFKLVKELKIKPIKTKI